MSRKAQPQKQITMASTSMDIVTFGFREACDRRMKLKQRRMEKTTSQSQQYQRVAASAMTSAAKRKPQDNPQNRQSASINNCDDSDSEMQDMPLEKQQQSSQEIFKSTLSPGRISLSKPQSLHKFKKPKVTFASDLTGGSPSKGTNRTVCEPSKSQTVAGSSLTHLFTPLTPCLGGDDEKYEYTPANANVVTPPPAEEYYTSLEQHKSPFSPQNHSPCNHFALKKPAVPKQLFPSAATTKTTTAKRNKTARINNRKRRAAKSSPDVWDSLGYVSAAARTCKSGRSLVLPQVPLVVTTPKDFQKAMDVDILPTDARSIIPHATKPHTIMDCSTTTTNNLFGALMFQRGRPKGSKNRAKKRPLDETDVSSAPPNTTTPSTTNSVKKTKRGRPKGSTTKKNHPTNGKDGNGTTATTVVVERRNRGRPKGSKNIPKIQLLNRGATARKRGRPKGSKNKPKIQLLNRGATAVIIGQGLLACPSGDPNTTTTTTTATGIMEEVGKRKRVPLTGSKISKTKKRSAAKKEPKTKKRRGRPKGSKNNPKKKNNSPTTTTLYTLSRCRTCFGCQMPSDCRQCLNCLQSIQDRGTETDQTPPTQCMLRQCLRPISTHQSSSLSTSTPTRMPAPTSATDSLARLPVPTATRLPLSSDPHCSSAKAAAPTASSFVQPTSTSMPIHTADQIEGRHKSVNDFHDVDSLSDFAGMSDLDDWSHSSEGDQEVTARSDYTCRDHTEKYDKEPVAFAASMAIKTPPLSSPLEDEETETEQDFDNDNDETDDESSSGALQLATPLYSSI
jgi:hypothetical protein